MATRPTLSTKTKPQVPAAERMKLDVEQLMELEAFRRFAFTVFQLCGMYSGSFHSEAAFLAYQEGRRSLGLDILRTLERSGADAHIRILQAGSTLEEADNDRRKHDRNADLDDGQSGVDRHVGVDRSRDDGPGFIQYGQPSEGSGN